MHVDERHGGPTAGEAEGQYEEPRITPQKRDRVLDQRRLRVGLERNGARHPVQRQAQRHQEDQADPGEHRLPAHALLQHDPQRRKHDEADRRAIGHESEGEGLETLCDQAIDQNAHGYVGHRGKGEGTQQAIQQGEQHQLAADQGHPQQHHPCTYAAQGNRAQRPNPVAQPTHHRRHQANGQHEQRTCRGQGCTPATKVRGQVDEVHLVQPFQGAGQEHHHEADYQHRDDQG